MNESFYPNQGVYTSEKTRYINFGGTTVLKSGVRDTFELSSYLSFDLSSIDKNSNIVSAKLKLYSLDKSVLGDVILNLAILNENFIDTNIIYEDIISQTFLTAFDVTTINSFVEIDLKEQVQSHVKVAPLYNFGVSIYKSTTEEGFVTFANIGYDIADYYPVLEIEYEQGAVDNLVMTSDSNFLITTSTSKVDDKKIATTFTTINSSSNQYNYNTGLGIVMIKYLYLVGEALNRKVFLENKQLEDFYISYPEQAINILPDLGKGIVTTLAASDNAELLVFSQIEPKIYGFINGTQDSDSGNTIIGNDSKQNFDMTGILSVNSSDDYFTNAYFTEEHFSSLFNQPKFNYEDVTTSSSTDEVDVTVNKYGIVTVPAIGTPSFLTKSRTIKLTPADMFNLTNAYLNVNVVVEINDNMKNILADESPAVMANVTTNNSADQSGTNEITLEASFSSSVTGTDVTILNDILLLSNKELDGLKVSVYQKIGTNQETELVQNKALNGKNIFLYELLSQGIALSSMTSLSGKNVQYRFVFTTTKDDDYELRLLSYARVPDGGTSIADKILYQSPIISVRIES